MNAKDINQTYDLYALTQGDTQLKHAGKYYIGACPFCGGTDRFNLKQGDAGWLWLCRHCTDAKYKTPIDYVMRRDGVDFKEALKSLGGETYKPNRNRARREAPVQRPESPPARAWQGRAWALIERAEAALWDARGADALAWLYARGLNDDSIAAARIGYIPKDFMDKPHAWGTPNGDTEAMKFPAGILIPCIIGAAVWYLKIRPDRPQPNQKYKHVRGGKQALFLGDTIAAKMPAVICEGEFDALLLLQKVRDFASVFTLGGAGKDLNLATWGLYLLRPSAFVLAFDMDNAGNKAAQKFAWLHDSQRLTIPLLREGDKDITDYYKSGGDLRALIQNAMTATV